MSLVTDRTYRSSGLQQHLMLAVLTILTAFTPFVLGHAISSGRWFELVWVAIVLWFWITTVWRAAYRFDVSGDTVEFRSILWRRRTRLGELRQPGQGRQSWGRAQGAPEGFRARKNVRTACTRRFSSVESPGRSSLRKMLRTCASTVFGET